VASVLAALAGKNASLIGRAMVWTPRTN